MKKALIIFARYLELGKVKTRLAKTMGNENALIVYKELLKHTLSISRKTNAAVFVFVAEEKSEKNTEQDLFNDFIIQLQNGEDLGERMLQAFENVFMQGYTNVCIIGSDCITLSENHISEAFETLAVCDIVIGPSLDGGYYLLGMKKMYASLFKNKIWSTDTVLSETIGDIKALQLSCKLLPVLSDIDTEQDWVQYQNSIHQTKSST